MQLVTWGDSCKNWQSLVTETTTTTNIKQQRQKQQQSYNKFIVYWICPERGSPKSICVCIFFSKEIFHSVYFVLQNYLSVIMFLVWSSHALLQHSTRCLQFWDIQQNAGFYSQQTTCMLFCSHTEWMEFIDSVVVECWAICDTAPYIKAHRLRTLRKHAYSNI